MAHRCTERDNGSESFRQMGVDVSELTFRMVGVRGESPLGEGERQLLKKAKGGKLLWYLRPSHRNPSSLLFKLECCLVISQHLPKPTVQPGTCTCLANTQ